CDISDAINNFMGVNEDYHPALGRKFDVDANVWLNKIDTGLRPDLAEHVIQNRSIVPGTSFFEIALAAARLSSGSDMVEIRDLDISLPLALLEKSTSDVRTQVFQDASSLVVSSRENGSDDPWLDHVRCRFGTYSGGADLGQKAPDTAFLENDKNGADVYPLAETLGLHYGPKFQLLSHARKSGRMQIEAILKETETMLMSGSLFDPIAMDCLLHGLIAGLEEDERLETGFAYVPSYVKKIRLFGAVASLRSARINIRRIGTKSIVADFDCFDTSGKLAARLIGLRFSAMRLAQPFDLTTASYGFVTVPIHELSGDDHRAVPITPSGLLEDVQTAVSKSKSIKEDVTYLLIEAICQKIAHETVSQLVDGSNRLTKRNALNGNQIYLDALLEMLELSELARMENGIWHVEPEAELPSVDLQISSLLDERPDAVLECAILSRLANISKDIVKNADHAPLLEILGAEVLKAFNVASVAAKHRLSIVAEAATHCVKKVKSNGVKKPKPEIVILSPAKNLLPAELSDISCDVMSFDEIDDHDTKYDAVIAPLGLWANLTTDTSLEAVAKLLRDGGTLLTFEFTSGSLLNLLGTIVKDDDDESHYGLVNEAELQKLLERGGFSEITIEEMTDSLSGMDIIAARLGSADEP
ncbi:MAG: polyketide synthase dehydratase domain-containing protein, partial [Pseudomonadota bacterium]